MVFRRMSVVVLAIMFAVLLVAGCGEAEEEVAEEVEGTINLNTASDEELMELRRVGERQVEEIKNLRPITEWRELYRVSGIGPPEVDYWQEQGAYLGEEDEEDY